jgi:hypothetical protein
MRQRSKTYLKNFFRESKRMKIKDQILYALEAFDFNGHHEQIYDNPNDLLDMGFPVSFIFPLIDTFHSSDSYQYHRKGALVSELIGVSYTSLISAIARCLGVPSCVGVGFSGRGFAMQAKIEAICEILKSN